MTALTTRVPARAVLLEATARSERDGNENRGFLSESHGFLPRQAPPMALPASHKAWDDIAAALPELFRTLTLRAAYDAMPVLPATAEALPDDALLRASALLGISAHAYFYADPEPPAALPPGISHPWQEVSDRLGRPAPHLSFTDLNAYNWRLRDGRRSDAMLVENLALLIPILGNEDERRFQMTPVEMLAVFTPILGAVVRAQEAVVADDAAALRRELVAVTDVVAQLARSFAKVDPNPHSPSYVNPVVWGKTVAPLATPYQAVDPPPGPSGTAIPAFQLLDILFGRRAYATTVGRESAYARQWFPPHWREFLAAAEQISVPEFVETQDDRMLRGVFDEAREAYAGDDGLLGRHRRKTFGFLDLSFKAGRTKTLGGFAGSFEDRPWDRMDAELALARLERTPAAAPPFHHARLDRVTTLCSGAETWVGEVVLDLQGAGVRYRPGSRCAVLPEQAPELVSRTLAALHARGDEPVQLDAAWQAAVGARESFDGVRVLPLRALLTFGRLRPVGRDIAKALYALTRNETLREVIEARAEDQWDLCELLGLLEDESGFRPATLWKPHPRELGRICALVPPESPRMYSISSAMPPDAETAQKLHLTVGALRYITPASAVSRPAVRHGTASSYLARQAASAGGAVSVQIVQPAGFELPDDPRRPVVMIAGGTGISPFLAMIAQRARQPDAGPTWLYLGTRTRADVYGEEQLRRHLAAGVLHLRVALSREDSSGVSEDGVLRWYPAPRQRVDALLQQETEAQRLWELLRPEADGGDAGHVYVCGRAGFAASVEASLETVAARYQPGDAARRQRQARETLFRLNGHGRYSREVYTTYPGPHFAQQRRRLDASEVVQHNDPDRSCWLIIEGRVYDVTRFAQLHPGGDKILRSYAGMDATQAYRTVGHDTHPEVHALLSQYEIGTVRRLDFGSAWSVAASPEGLRPVMLKDIFRCWIRLLYRVVEIENALANDYLVRTEPVTHDERAAAVTMSPYKARGLFETHGRFVDEHLAGLTGQRLTELWSLTSGLAAGRHGHDVRWMERELADVLSGKAAAEATGMEATVAEAFRRIGQAPAGASDSELAWCEATTNAVETEDRRVVADLKAALRAGVAVFERHERETAQRGATELLELAVSLPAIVRDYFTRLAKLS